LSAIYRECDFFLSPSWTEGFALPPMEAMGSGCSRSEADAELSKALGGQVEAISAGADRTEGFRTAKRKLDEAWELYNKAGNDQKIYKQAAAAAGEAYSLFAAVAREATAKKAAAKQAPRPQQAVQKPVQKSVTTTTQPPPQTQAQAIAPPVKAPEPARVVETKPEPIVESAALVSLRVDLQQLRRRLLDAKRSDERLDAFVAQGLNWADGWEQELKPTLADEKIIEIRDRVVSVETEIDKRVAALKAEDAKKAKEIAAAAAKAGPLPKDELKNEIRSAYVAYAKGDLARSETVLNAIVASKTKSAEAYLLRGAAKYTRAAMSRQKELYADAEKDFMAALKLNPSAGLDPNHFSPKLINFFQDVRKKQAGVK
jgi:tetratricopeptide (TPR) repeat protein